MTPATPALWHRWRRRLRRHRRPVAAGLAFLAVLVAWPSVSGDGPPSAASHARELAPGTSEVPDGLVAAPVRLADSGVVGLLRPGDIVDVVAADTRGRASLVAGGVTVLSVPATHDDPLGGDPFGGALVVLAVPSSMGVALAGAAATGPLSLLLHP